MTLSYYRIKFDRKTFQIDRVITVFCAAWVVLAEVAMLKGVNVKMCSVVNGDQLLLKIFMQIHAVIHEIFY